MTSINSDPYVITLTPGKTPERAAKECARYILNRWLPNNAGGVHLLAGPRLTKALETIYRTMPGPTEIRVTIRGNIPNLEIL